MGKLGGYDKGISVWGACACAFASCSVEVSLQVWKDRRSAASGVAQVTGTKTT